LTNLPAPQDHHNTAIANAVQPAPARPTFAPRRVRCRRTSPSATSGRAGTRPGRAWSQPRAQKVSRRLSGRATGGDCAGTRESGIVRCVGGSARSQPGTLPGRPRPTLSATGFNSRPGRVPATCGHRCPMPLGRPPAFAQVDESASSATLAGCVRNWLQLEGEANRRGFRTLNQKVVWRLFG
jgi:hypothetical protein